jgi:hypothetical protein
VLELIQSIPHRRGGGIRDKLDRDNHAGPEPTAQRFEVWTDRRIFRAPAKLLNDHFQDERFARCEHRNCIPTLQQDRS